MHGPRALLATSLLASLLIASPALAQSDDEVLLLLHGGIQGPVRLDLDPDDASVFERGQLTLVDTPDLINDIVSLPDGSILLAGPSTTRVSLSPSSREALDTLYTSTTTFSQLSTATGAAFGSGGGLARVFFGDARLSTITLLDLTTNQSVWATSLGIPGSGAELVRLVALPDSRLAVATNWPSVGVQGVDVLPTPGATDSSRIRFANAEHEGQPTDTTILPDLGTARDLAALDADTLLVTTRTSLVALSVSSRSVLWRVDVGDDSIGTPLTGELASARPLNSGRVAVATFEPGVWTQPHPSHRVHWLSVGSGSPTLVASSSALQRAPRRLAASASTGGTGTLGFTAGQVSGEPGELTDLDLVTGITVEPGTLRPGDTLAARVSLRNPSDLTISYGAIQIRATPGRTCLDASDDDLVLAQLESDTVAPGSIITVQGQLEVDASFADGSWCAYVMLVDLDQTTTRLATEANFTVDGAPARAPVEDLDFSRFDPDAGTPDAGDAGPDDLLVIERSEGCGCRSTRAPSPSTLTLIVVLALLGICPRRRT